MRAHTSIHLDADVLGRIQDAAAAERRPPAELIRRALRRAYGPHPWELAVALAGVVVAKTGKELPNG